MAETTVNEQEARTRREYIRKDVMERSKLDEKTPEDVQQGKLDRAQLYLFLTEMALKIMSGTVLLSRMSPRHFWCQTGFTIENNVVYGKYGDSPYQPIGWDTGTEFYPLDIAKLIWKHEFAWYDPKGLEAMAPWDVQIDEVSIDEVEDPDGSVLTDKEQKLFAGIMKDLKEELDWAPDKGWKRDPNFVPQRPKRKHTPAEIMEMTTKWLEEREAQFLKDADTRIASITDLEPYKTAHAALEIPEGEEAPEFGEWLQAHIAESIATKASATYAKELQGLTEPYTEEEINTLARRSEHEFRVRETLKMAAMNSPRLDRKIQQIVADNPTIGAELEGLDILSFTSQTVDWIRMRLDEDSAARIVKGTTVKPRISFDEIRDVEAKTAMFLYPELVRISDSLVAAGGMAKLDEEDELVYQSHAVVAQTQAALPGVAKYLAPHVEEILMDRAIELILEYFDEKGYIPKPMDETTIIHGPGAKTDTPAAE